MRSAAKPMAAEDALRNLSWPEHSGLRLSVQSLVQVRAVPGLQMQLAGLVAEGERVGLAAFQLGSTRPHCALTLHGYSNAAVAKAQERARPSSRLCCTKPSHCRYCKV